MANATVEKVSHLNAYTVKEIGEGPEKRSIFTKIGAAFPNKDGQGFNVVLDANPVDGKIVLRTPKKSEEESEG